MPGSNKRVYFACLGVSKCSGGPLLNNLISADLSLDININHVLSQGSTKTVGTYSDAPQAQFSYTEYLQPFVPIQDEYGLNKFVGFKMCIGSDHQSGGLFGGSSAFLTNVQGSPPYASTMVSLANLTSISYNFPVNDFFTTTRSFTGYSKKPSSPGSSFTESEASPETRRRQHFTGTLPDGISNNAIQNIEVNYSINRTPVPEFATRKPYASYVNFPIETTVTFELLTQNLDGYTIDSLQTACKSTSSIFQDISISVCDCGSLDVKKAYLTSLRYGGGEANSNSNQTLSVTYTSYEAIPGIEPVIIVPDQDPCG